MNFGAFLTGVGQGIAQGHQYQQEQEQKKEELKLRKRIFESQDKLRQMEEQKIAETVKEKQQQETHRQTLRDVIG